MLLLVLVGGLVWLLRPRPGRIPAEDPDLVEAEEEVRELDAMTSPDEADDHLPDWGPGAPGK